MALAMAVMFLVVLDMGEKVEGCNGLAVDFNAWSARGRTRRGIFQRGRRHPAYLPESRIKR
jgi:hypothetical protein